jgi:hypothetical protein
MHQLIYLSDASLELLPVLSELMIVHKNLQSFFDSVMRTCCAKAVFVRIQSAFSSRIEAIDILLQNERIHPTAAAKKHERSIKD